MRPISQTGTKVCLSDPELSCGRGFAQKIKVTLRITGLYFKRDHIDWNVWHLDVASSYPRAESGSKGQTVRLLKGYVR